MPSNQRLRRLLRVLLPEGGALITIFEGYFDESGDFDEPPGVFCIAGYFIDSGAAEAMDRDWLLLLQKHEIPYFHMVACAHGNDFFSEIKKSKRVQVVKDFISLIKKHTLQGFAIMARGDLFPDEIDVYSFHADACIKALRAFLATARLDGQLAYFFEAGHKSKGRAYNRLADEISTLGATMTFAGKEEVRLLQAADLLAWQAAKYVKDSLTQQRPPRKDFESLMEHPHSIYYVTHDAGELTLTVEEWPMRRRGPDTGSLTWAAKDGPLPYILGDDGIPMLPVRRPLGWRLGAGRILSVVFEEEASLAKFQLGFKPHGLLDSISALVAAVAEYSEEEIPLIVAKECRVVSLAEGQIVEVELGNGQTLRFHTPLGAQSPRLIPLLLAAMGDLELG